MSHFIEVSLGQSGLLDTVLLTNCLESTGCMPALGSQVWEKNRCAYFDLILISFSGAPALMWSSVPQLRNLLESNI